MIRKRRWLCGLTGWPRRLFHDSYWWVRHRVDPRHRYNVVRTDLRPDYYDPDTRILHAVMCEVARFVERTRNTIDWDNEPGHKAAWDVLEKAATWWKTRKPSFDAETLEEEQRLESQEDQMLVSVIGVRRYMWYP